KERICSLPLKTLETIDFKSGETFWSLLTVPERILRIPELRNFVDSLKMIPEVVDGLNSLQKATAFDLCQKISVIDRRKLLLVLIRDISPRIAEIIDGIPNSRASKVLNCRWFGGRLPPGLWDGLTTEEKVQAFLPFVSLCVPQFTKF